MKKETLVQVFSCEFCDIGFGPFLKYLSGTFFVDFLLPSRCETVKHFTVKHLQPVFTYSKLTIETLEHGVKYVQS